MTAPRWLDRAPTAEEVRAHAEAYPSDVRADAGLWMLRFELAPEQIPMVIALDETDMGYAARLHATIGGGGRWLPLTADGVPVEAQETSCVQADPDRARSAIADAAGAPHAHDLGNAACDIAVALDAINRAARPEAPTIEQRLFAARRASGLRLGRLLDEALDAYSKYRIRDLPDLADESIVEMVERWVREHPREGRSYPDSNGPMTRLPETDDEAVTWLRYGRPADVGETMARLYGGYRAQGLALLDAYEKALLAHVRAVEGL